MPITHASETPVSVVQSATHELTVVLVLLLWSMHELVFHVCMGSMHNHFRSSAAACTPEMMLACISMAIH